MTKRKKRSGGRHPLKYKKAGETKKEATLENTARTYRERFLTTPPSSENKIYTLITYTSRDDGTPYVTISRDDEMSRLCPCEIELNRGNLMFNMTLLTTSNMGETVSTSIFQDLYETYEARTFKDIRNELSEIEMTFRRKMPKIKSHLSRKIYAPI